MHVLRFLCCLALTIFVLASWARAGDGSDKQDNQLSAAARPRTEPLGPQAPVIAAAMIRTPTHKFMDRDNALLFAAAAAGRTADVLTTWRFRDNGYREVVLSNGFVDNRAAFAAYSYGMVAANVGVAYALHRMGWHKAERAVSVIDISYTGALAVHNYALVR